jgi:hypothetical protein
MHCFTAATQVLCLGEACRNSIKTRLKYKSALDTLSAISPAGAAAAARAQHAVKLVTLISRFQKRLCLDEVYGQPRPGNATCENQRGAARAKKGRSHMQLLSKRFASAVCTVCINTLPQHPRHAAQQTATPTFRTTILSAFTAWTEMLSELPALAL